MKLRFFWDFHGPSAERTARHFEQHLGEFLARHSIELPVMTAESGGGSWAVHCDPPDVPAELEPLVEGEPERVSDQLGQALRPNRVESLAAEK